METPTPVATQMVQTKSKQKKILNAEKEPVWRVRVGELGGDDKRGRGKRVNKRGYIHV